MSQEEVTKNTEGHGIIPVARFRPAQTRNCRSLLAGDSERTANNRLQAGSYNSAFTFLRNPLCCP